MKLKSKKSALLLSFTSLLLCFAMLAGSTFAWFTDTATTGVNKIVSGKLKVNIVAEDGVTSLTGEGKELKFQNNANSTDILWEPGVTFLTQGFKIKNDGNLALKWKAQVNKDNIENGKADPSAKDNMSLLDVIDFSVVTSQAKDAEAVAIEDFVGHLEKEKTSEKTYYIKAHMQESAGNDYQSLTLEGITITVYATQDTVENDSFNNQYDKDAEIVAVTPDTIAAVDFTKSNAVYHFAAGSYSGTTLTVRDNTNTVFEAAGGATFDNVTIKYAANRYGVTDKSDSSMIIKGFNVTGVLDVNCADGKLIVENNTAQKIKVVMNRQDGKGNADIQFKDNKLNGGNYGIELVPNHSGYTLTISGNEFTNITSHAISVMGYQSDLTATDETRTAAASITVSGNTFNSYGRGKAAFKIWGDTNLAPNGTDALTEAAQALADSVKTNNTFGSDLDSTCVVADFFGKKVAFN